MSKLEDITTLINVINDMQVTIDTLRSEKDTIEISLKNERDEYLKLYTDTKVELDAKKENCENHE